MSRNFDCYICSSKSGKEYFSINNYPAYIVPLPAQFAVNIKKAILPLYACDTCGHMQVPEPDADLQKSIYEEYYNYYVVDSSEALVPHYRTPFISFVNELKASAAMPFGNLLEIGCSSGEKVEFFAGFAKTYTGVDPSHRIEIAKTKFPNHSFVQGYFPDALPKAVYDIIVSQFNLEHILNINKFVASVYDSCNNNGIFIVQVPDANFFLRTQQPNFLAHEHIQYFTKETLALLLQKNGFMPMAWGNDGPSLICAAKKMDEKVEVDNAATTKLLQAVNQQATIFNQAIDLPKNVIFYGVGPQLFWLLNKYNYDVNEAIIVDDNPSYKGLCLPGFKNEILSLTKEIILQQQNIVLSLNNVYHQTVIEKIKNLGVTCNIILNENNHWKTIKI